MIDDTLIIKELVERNVTHKVIVEGIIQGVVKNEDIPFRTRRGDERLDRVIIDTTRPGIDATQGGTFAATRSETNALHKHKGRRVKIVLEVLNYFPGPLDRPHLFSRWGALMEVQFEKLLADLLEDHGDDHVAGLTMRLFPVGQERMNILVRLGFEDVARLDHSGGPPDFAAFNLPEGDGQILNLMKGTIARVSIEPLGWVL